MPRFSEYLESGGLWIQELVCQKLGRAPMRNADQAAWDLVAEEFLALPHLRSLLDELGDFERDLLFLAVFSANGATDRELLEYARRQGAERNEAMDALYVLSRSGLVICARGWSNDISFFVPDDMAHRLITLRHHGQPALLVPADEAPRTFVSEDLALYRDIYTFLTAIEKEPLQLTQQTGLIYKRQLEKVVLPRLEVSERGPADGTYPPRFEFLYEFCAASQLVTKTRDGHLMVSGAPDRWFALGPLAQSEALFNYWNHRCLRAGWRYEQRVLVRVLQTCTPEVWYQVSSLNPLIQTWYGKSGHTATDALRTLAYQSLIDLGMDGNGNAASLRLTPLGARVIKVAHATPAGATDPVLWDCELPITSTFVLQPNFEVLVPKTLDLSVRHRLDQLADLTRADNISRYRLTDGSIQRALEHGWQAEALLDFLDRHSETSLPQNVRVSVTDWADRFGRISFWDVLLLRVKDKALVRELKAHPAISPYLHGEVGPTAVICYRKDHPKLVAALKEYGYWPQVGVVTPDPEDVAVPRTKARDFLLLDFGAGQRLPMAINQQIPKPTSVTRRTAPLRRKERGGRDLTSGEVESLVNTAIAEHKQIEIEYFAPTTGRSRRTIDPKAVVGDQLEAFCHLRAEERRFTLTHILEIWVLE